MIKLRIITLNYKVLLNYNSCLNVFFSIKKYFQKADETGHEASDIRWYDQASGIPLKINPRNRFGAGRVRLSRPMANEIIL